jgi:hypothetical protein
LRGRAPSAAPHAGVTGARGGRHLVAPGDVCHGQLQCAHERPQQDRTLTQPHDRICHQLARPVIGDLAAALHADDVDATTGELVSRADDVLIPGMPTQRQHRFVFHEQERVGDLALGPCRVPGTLHVPGWAVVHPSEPLDLQVHEREGSTQQTASACALRG